MVTSPKYCEDDFPPAGSVVVIPLSSGRFGVATVVKCVTGVDTTESTPTRQIINTRVLVVPARWVGAEPIRPSDADIRNSLCLTHHSWNSEQQACWITDLPPDGVRFVGSIELMPEDLTMDSVKWGNWDNLSHQIHLQWRWDHERDELLREEEAERKSIEEKSRLHVARQAEILRTTTLESLASRVWFTQWDDEWEVSFRREAQILIGDLIRDLRMLPKPIKSQVCKNMRQCVEAFNRLNAQESLIQTTHCEDILNALYLIATVTKHPDLMEQLDALREW
jgi:hypothetical protein